MKRVIIGLLPVFTLLAAVACAGSPGEAPDSISQNESMPRPTATPTAQPRPTVTVPGVSGASVPGVSDEDRLIICNGYLTLVVEDVAGVMETITGLANSYGGFVVSSNSWRDGDRMMGTITIRVDADHFYDAISQMRTLAVEVKLESTSGQDVTEEYIDLEASLKNPEASEQQLLALMQQAGTVEEILKVQQELTRTRGQIEQTRGRM